MKLIRALICIVLVAGLLVGCRNNNTDNPTTLPPSPNGTTTTTTLVDGSNGGSTSADSSVTTTLPTVQGTTDSTDVPSTVDGSSPRPEMQKVTVHGLPVIVGDTRNRIKISAAGLLNGNAGNPMFILVTNIGEDDIFSASITANAGGKTINFNISYLPRGGSVWAESVDLYKYNADDKFIIDTDAVIVTSTSAGVPIDRNYTGILNVYTGEKDGGRGVFIKNVSGKTIRKLVIKYRPIASGGGLYSAPSQIVIENFVDGSTAFKANSYLFEVDVADIQINY